MRNPLLCLPAPPLPLLLVPDWVLLVSNEVASYFEVTKTLSRHASDILGMFV